MENKIKIMMCEINKEPYIEEIICDVESMQEKVGGYFQYVNIHGEKEGLIVVCNEDGKLMNLPMNQNFNLGIVGNFFIARYGIEELISLTEEDIDYLNKI